MGCLRLFLALTVVIAHTDSFFGFQSIGGSAAVEMFFMISGFYMMLILNEKYIGSGSYKLFISNRFLKIFPIYFISILFILFISTIALTQGDERGALFDSYNAFSKGELSFVSYVYIMLTNVIVFGQDTLLFLTVDNTLGDFIFTSNFHESSPKLHKFLLNGPAWSISIELMFYLIAPLILTRGLKVIFIIMLMSLFLKLYIHFVLGFTNDPWTYRFFPSELIFFMAGALSYSLYKYLKIIGFSLVFKKYITLMFILTLVIVVLKYFNLLIDKVLVLYLMTFISLPFLFHLTKKNTLDRHLGELSYPIYIFHMPIIIVLSIFSLGNYKSEVVSLITILLSFLAVRYIVNPIENYRQNRIIHPKKL